MGKLHYPIWVFKVIFKNGEEYTTKRSCTMSYSEPDDKIENTYTQDAISDFIEKYHFFIYTDYTWRFKKYIRFDGDSKKILISDIANIEVSMTHRGVREYATIKEIGKALKYEEFLQFIFDKEQELKSVITGMGGK